MNFIWKLSCKISNNNDIRPYIFLIFAFLFYSFVGFLMGLIIYFILKVYISEPSVFLICMAGYPGLFIGVIGGTLWLYNKF